MTDDRIIASGVDKTYRSPAGDVLAVEGLDLRLSSGQLLILSGPSGSGKPPSSTCWPAGSSPSRDDRLAGARPPLPLDGRDVAVIPQAVALLDELTVEENITLALGARRPIAELGDELAGVVGALGITPLLNRPVDHISVGERQRVMIARALATDSTVVLADEPTAHQDERNAAIILDLLEASDRARGRVPDRHPPDRT